MVTLSGTVAVAVAARFHRYLRQGSTLHGQAESNTIIIMRIESNRIETHRIMDLLVMLLIAPRQSLGWEVGGVGTLGKGLGRAEQIKGVM